MESHGEEESATSDSDEELHWAVFRDEDDENVEHDDDNVCSRRRGASHPTPPRFCRGSLPADYAAGAYGGQTQTPSHPVTPRRRFLPA